MALRVTQTSLEVLADGSGGKLRVTQQYIEVMGPAGVAPQGVSQSLSLSQTATETVVPSGSEISRTVTDTVSLTDSASNVANRPVSGSHSLAFSQTAAENLNLAGNASNALALTQDVVITGDRTVVVNDAMALTDAATLPRINVSAASDLSGLTDSASQSGITEASASSALSFAQSVTNGVIFVSVSDTMTLVHSPYAGQNISVSASNAIALTQTDTPGIYFASGSDALALIQAVFGDLQGSAIRALSDALGITDAAVGVVHDFGRQIAHTITFIQSVAAGQPRSVNVTDILSLANIATQRQGVANVSVADFLGLQQSAGQVFFASASSTLSLTQAAFRRFFASHVLGLTDTVLGKVTKPMTDDLGLTDLASRLLVVNRTFTDNLGLNSSVAAFISHNGILCQYAPFIGAGPGAAVPATMPTLGTAKLTLTHPFVSPTRTVVLRNPQFGNVDRLAFDRINRDTRGGTLIMFADPAWPKQQTMNITVMALTRQKKLDLLDFLSASVGQDIGLLDHENRLWKGIILTPDATINNDSRGGHTVTLEFEGALQ